MSFVITGPLYLWILSQVAVFFSICFAVWSYLVKDRSKTLFINTIACFFLCGSCMLLSNWVLAGLLVLAMVRNIFFWILDKRPTKYNNYIRWAGVFLLLVATVLIVVFLRTWWFDWVMLAANIYIIIVMSINNIHWLRSAFILGDSASIVNHLNVFNIIGIVQCCIQIVANLIFYVLFFTSKKRKKTEQTKQVDTVVTNE